MINDSVREELKDKISPIVKKITFKRVPLLPNRIESHYILNKINSKGKNAVKKNVTTEISAKPTSRTLVEFNNKNTTVPEWRLQLQNAVLKRQNQNAVTNNVDLQPASQAKLVTNGAKALKPEPIPEPVPVLHKNPTVNNALQRIQQSRRQFLVEEKQQENAPVAPTAAIEPPPAKNYPFRIAAKAGEVLPVPVEPKPATINPTIKPRMATPVKAEKLDTNKLPPLPMKVASAFDIHSKTPDEEKIEETEEIIEEVETEEIEDLAPFAMRFNAGLFDLIICSFLSFILLTPFMASSEGWMTSTGILTFAVTCAVVMFIYMTVSIGFYGRTFGMRIFVLEVVDIEGEEYPTIHQAAVSSCLYILSLALGGIGFLTLFFNHERRAVHDLISGTIVIKEI